LTQVRRFLVVLTLSVKLPSYFLSLSDYFILDLVWVSFGYMEGGVFHFITVFVVNGYQNVMEIQRFRYLESDDTEDSLIS
jgi:hypothetical protein